MSASVGTLARPFARDLFTIELIALPQTGHDRSPGLHAAQALRYRIAKRWRRKEPRSVRNVAGIYEGAAWTDSSNALWPNVSSNALTPQDMGTSDAAGLPVAPLLVNADEVIGTGTPSSPSGAVLHPIRFTLNHILTIGSGRRRRRLVWVVAQLPGAARSRRRAKFRKHLHGQLQHDRPAVRSIG